MIGRTPGNIVAIRPLKDGVIADFDTTERMLRYFIQKVHKRRHLAKPRIVVCVPSGITGVEQRAVKDAGYAAGARKVYIIEEPMAAAIGAGLPGARADRQHGRRHRRRHHRGRGHLARRHRDRASRIRVGGDELDNAIIQYVKKEYSLMLGERTAEEIKMAIGSAFPMPDEPHAEIRGRDLVTGLPKTIVVSRRGDPQGASRSRSTRSSTRSRPRSTSARPSCPATSWTAASCSPAAARCSRASTSGCATRPGMPIHIADDPLDSRGARLRQVRRGVRGPAAGADLRAAPLSTGTRTATVPGTTEGEPATGPRRRLVGHAIGADERTG